MNILNRLLDAGVSAPLAASWALPLDVAMGTAGISTERRQAAFLAQVVHESLSLRRLVENLNYTPAGLQATFNTKTNIRFSDTLAAQFGRTAAHPANQPMIANIAYADRLGNGGVGSGDGWNYRGRGPIQLTGKYNYARCSSALGIDLVTGPDALLTPGCGALAAAWFWSEGNGTAKSLNALADAGQIDKISRVVNGGTNGLVERRTLYENILKGMA